MFIFKYLKILRDPGWPELICNQCVSQVSRAHAFKKRVEKSDEQLKEYIKSLTVIVEEPKEVPSQLKVPQPVMQEIQIQTVNSIAIV